MGSGLFATWINSDDMLCKDALTRQFGSGTLAPDVYVGDCISIDQNDQVMFTHRGRVESFEDLVRVSTVWRQSGSIDQPATVFPLELFRRVGGLNEENYYTMDYELWGRFLLEGARIRYTGIPFGYFRWHTAQKTQASVKQNDSMIGAAKGLVPRSSLPAETKREILAELEAYRLAYPQLIWKQSGRLANMGLPRPVVTGIRRLKQRLVTAIRKSG
jgi:hypothetical protein